MLYQTLSILLRYGSRYSSPAFIYVYVIFGILALIASPFMIYFSRKRTVRRALRKIPNYKIGDVMENELAQVTGKITLAGKTLVAPFSQKLCAYYHIVVEEDVNRGDTSNWQTMIEEEETGDIIITDGSGYAIIDTTDLLAHINVDKVYSSGFLNDATPEMEQILKKHGLASTGSMGFNKSMRYTEIALTEHEMVTAAGHGTMVDARKLKLRVPPKMILSLKALPGSPVYMSDDKKSVKEGLMLDDSKQS